MLRDRKFAHPALLTVFTLRKQVCLRPTFTIIMRNDARQGPGVAVIMQNMVYCSIMSKLAYIAIKGANQTVDRIEIAQLAKLAKLSFSDDQLDAFTEEFSNILAFVDQLSELDTQGVSVERKADSAVVRDDQVAPSLPKQTVVELAPETDGDGFLIPRVV